MNNVKISGKFYLENDLMLLVENMKQPVGVIKQVYEVLRVVNGKPLFWEHHFARFLESCSIADVLCNDSASDFRGQLARLIEMNRLGEGNIRIDLFQLENDRMFRYAFIPHSYPSATDYERGVPLGLLHAERENPHAKIVHQVLRDQANQLMVDNNWYEVLLVDHEGRITEGSRSNVFFVRDDRFFTPRASQILLGITRSKVLECIDRLGYLFEEADIFVDDLATFDAVFLTGTSPQVLPVSRIEKINFQVENHAMRQVQDKFNKVVADYLLQPNNM
ncbi:aminotransferase class IV [Gaoshiqia sediminis]|uniref:branched-chain-amino-acid transaminase n=1 Tax=Gaoshiqia sediminis TaxID=2986998 RepID=A0AA42C738_9BACT|nr:aminotransferase class IV [Gaoshiqia sediminis]MCW0484593.1 aminotransferase class IV [Gaoshiqia sediminis]